MSERTTFDDDPRPDSVLAAEYVLHLLDPSDRRATEARLDRDGGFRREVAGWAETFAPLGDAIPEATPPARVRSRLLREIGEPGKKRRLSIRRVLLGLVGGAGLAAAAIVGLAVLPEGVEMPGAGGRLQAELTSEDTPYVFEASYQDGTLTLRREAGAVPQGRDLQLWLAPGPSGGPVSLGVLPPAEEVRIQVPPAIQETVLPSALLEVSEEPIGGSPEAGPTGEVLAIGEIGDG